jgi:hypothetical protein
MADYEYKDYVAAYSHEYAEYHRVARRGEDYARMVLWQSDQYVILPDLWKWFDEGWVAMTQIGPAGYHLRCYKSYRDNGVFEWIMMIVCTIGSAGVGLLLLPFFRHELVEPIEFRVKLRRRIDG